MKLTSFWAKIIEFFQSPTKIEENEEKVFTKLKSIIELNGNVLIKSVSFKKEGFSIEFFDRSRAKIEAEIKSVAKDKERKMLESLKEEEDSVAELMILNPVEYEESILSGDLTNKKEG